MSRLARLLLMAAGFIVIINLSNGIGQVFHRNQQKYARKGAKHPAQRHPSNLAVEKQCNIRITVHPKWHHSKDLGSGILNIVHASCLTLCVCFLQERQKTREKKRRKKKKLQEIEQTLLLIGNLQEQMVGITAEHI